MELRTRQVSFRANLLLIFLTVATVAMSSTSLAALQETASPPPVSTTSFTATGDARVESGSPDANFGAQLMLSADTNPETQSYLQFTFTGLQEPVTRATLRVFVSGGSSDGPAVLTTGTGWTESGITWNNRPAPTSTAVDDLGVVTSGAWAEFNVTSLVGGNGTYAFAVVGTSDDGVDMHSRENGTTQPQVEITTGGTPVSVSAALSGGTYTSPLDVALSASEPATIYYTVDGAQPTATSAVYSAPIPIAISTTLRFFAVTPDDRSSQTVQEVYTIQVTGFRNLSYGGNTAAPTAKDAQSKLWYADGTWWGSLFHAGSGSYRIFRLDTATQTWVDTGTVIDARFLGSHGKLDALWDGSKLYIVTHRYASSGDVKAKVMRFSYTGGAFSQDVAVDVDTLTGPEVVTIAKDSTGTLWLTWMFDNQIYVTHSSGNDETWVPPYVLPVLGSTVSADDISAVVSFAGKIGVMWSNQAENTMNFAYHVDGAPDTDWTGEVAFQVSGDAEAADDHINVKADSTGRVFVATKTSLNRAGDPLVHLLVRGTDGAWTSHTFGTVGDNHTRAIVQLDESAGVAYVFAAQPCCNGGAIVYKSASLATLDFPPGLGTPVIASDIDTTINNVTSTKQSVSAETGLVILAADDTTRTYLHNFLPLESESGVDSRRSPMG